MLERYAAILGVILRRLQKNGHLNEIYFVYSDDRINEIWHVQIGMEMY
jgi:hypothetical protein